MTSNMDILSFLKAEQETRAKEKEEERHLRAEERQEDRKHILEMIKTGVQIEVKAAIQPVEDRLELQEKVNQELHKQLPSLVREMELLKKKPW